MSTPAWTEADEASFRAMQVRRALAGPPGYQPLGAGLARASDPVTSHAAGVYVSEREQGIFAEILMWLGPRGEDGGTSLEIADGTGIDRVTISPRLKPMEKLGLVARTDQRRTGSTGRASIVWVACEKNLAADTTGR